jgi:uncharacterized protein YyaL (SSP411 family)
VAHALADQLLDEFWDEAGGLADRPRDQGGPSELSRRLRPVRDLAGPSANAEAARLLAAVSALTGDPLYRSLADALVDALLPEAAALGVAGAGLLALAVNRLPAGALGPAD